MSDLINTLSKILQQNTSTAKRWCHGATRGDGGGYRWYVPRGKKITEDSRCEWCATNHIVSGCDKYRRSIYNIGCHSAKDTNLFAVKFGGFVVWLTKLGDSDIPFYLEPSNRRKTGSGLGIVIVPTSVEYVINIQLDDKKDENDYFTVEAKMGDQTVVINEGQSIYHDGRCKIKGMKASTDQSFLFYSLSRGEASSPAINQNNKIKLTLKRFRRKEPIIGTNISYIFASPSDRFKEKSGCSISLQLLSNESDEIKRVVNFEWKNKDVLEMTETHITRIESELETERYNLSEFQSTTQEQLQTQQNAITRLESELETEHCNLNEFQSSAQEQSQTQQNMITRLENELETARRKLKEFIQTIQLTVQSQLQAQQDMISDL